MTRVVAAASVVCALLFCAHAAAQEVNLSTTIASLGPGTVTSRINLDAVQPKPATDRGLSLPALTLIDDGGGPRVTSVVLDLPALDLGEATLESRLGDQSLPALFRATPLAGSGLTSPIRGVTLTTNGTTPWRLSLGQIGSGSPAGDSAALAAAAASFTPSTRLSVMPRVVFQSGTPDPQTSIGTALQANVTSQVALVSDVGVAGVADTLWAPIASARLVGHWSRAGIETSVLRGAPERDGGFVSSRNREAVQTQVRPLPGLTLAALTSSSRPAADPAADDTIFTSLRIAYEGLPTGLLVAVRQRETTASWASETSSFEWRQRGPGRATVRYVRQRSSTVALDGIDECSSRVEIDLPALAPPTASRLDLRAALMAESGSQTELGVNSRLSGRLHLLDAAALTGETELGITGGDGQVLRALRLTTDMPVVPATRLQLSYSYRPVAEFPSGQAFEARLLRRLRLGW